MPRLILASVSRHFNNAVDADLSMFVEGEIRDTRKKKSFFELRVDGPDVKKLSGITSFDFTVNILIQVAMDKSDFHHIQRVTGTILELFRNAITIYDNEDDSVIGCAGLVSDYKGRDVRIFQYGQIDPTIHIQQTAVAGTYKITL